MLNEMMIKMVTNNNPIIMNLFTMLKKGDEKGVENFARNLCKEKGIDFDKDFTEFKKNFSERGNQNELRK